MTSASRPTTDFNKTTTQTGRSRPWLPVPGSVARCPATPILLVLLAMLGLWLLGPARAQAQSQPTSAIADIESANDIVVREPRVCVLPDQPPYQGRSLWNANLWSGGIVPYEFDSNTTAGNRTAMRQAMDTLEAIAYVHFVERTGQGDYLHIQNDTQNHSYVGEIGGAQTVGIYNWNYRFIMCHELMHALGVWHEQQRPDRDQYLTVNHGNIQPGWEPQYEILSGAAPQGAYDFDSVMHYGACDASVCCPPNTSCSCTSNCWTMTALPAYAQFQGLMGQITHLSSGDAAGLVSRYGPPTCPVFTQQPTGVATNTGQTVTFTAAATGAGTPAFRWRRNSQNLTDDGRITGSMGQMLTIRSVSQVDVGSYECVATNSCGSTTSDAAALSTECAAWSQRAGTVPSPRYHPVMSYDSTRGVTVLFGGYTGAINRRPGNGTEPSGTSEQ